MIFSKPRILSKEIINSDDYVCAVCECPLPLNYGHAFKKSDHQYGTLIYFCCTECNKVYGIFNK